MIRFAKLEDAGAVSPEVVLGVYNQIGLVVRTNVIPVPNRQMARVLHLEIVQDAEIEFLGKPNLILLKLLLELSDKESKKILSLQLSQSALLKSFVLNLRILIKVILVLRREALKKTIKVNFSTFGRGGG